MRSIAVGATVMAVSLLRSLADGFGLTDESWFLQVVSRLRAGAVLYRDVSYGATPLAVYVTTAVSHLVGVEVLAVKISTNAAFALIVLLVERLVRRAGVSSLASWLLVGAMVLLARPYANPPYTPMAMAFFVATLATMLAAVRWRRRDRPRRGPVSLEYALAGVWAGLSFSAKQNVGLLALGAALAAVIVTTTEFRRARRRCSLVVAGFAAAVLVALTPVVVSGGFAGLLDYGFTGKGAYLRVGGVGYGASLANWAREARTLPLPSAAVGFAHGLVLVLPFVVALAVVWRRRELETADRVLVLFAVAAVATAFPRWDRFHMGYAVPVHVLTLAALLVRNRSARLARAEGRGSIYWVPRAAVALVFVVAVVPPLTAVAGTDGRRPSTLPHFSGALVTADTDERLARSARLLAAASGGRPTFILGSDAGFWYLESGLRNPTPFDIPTAASVGRSGAEALQAAMSSGRLSQVCVSNLPRSANDLVELAAFVQQHWQNATDAGPCTLYRASNAEAQRREGSR